MSISSEVQAAINAAVAKGDWSTVNNLSSNAAPAAAPAPAPIASANVPSAPASNNYFASNPDVAAAYNPSSGLTPQQFAEQHYTNYGQYEGRATPAAAPAPAPAPRDQNWVNQLAREAATQAGGTISYSDALNAGRNLGLTADQIIAAAASTGVITGAPPSDYVSNYSPQNILYNNGININSPAISTPGLTPEVATRLMERSITTGVPTSEFDMYGGYDAVARAFEAAGGQYDRSTIPTDRLNEYARQIADTGVGDFNTLTLADVPLTYAGLQGLINSGADQSTIDRIRQEYYLDPYSQLVQDQYATIGRTDFGEAQSNIDQAGFDYWRDRVASGEISEEDLPKAFADAVLQYKKDKPEDPYTKYVNEYQLGQYSDPMKQGLGSILEDRKVTFAEADTIQAYRDNYGFSPEDIARVTGVPIADVNRVLSTNPVTWTAPELKPVVNQGRSIWLNPNTGQKYRSKA